MVRVKDSTRNGRGAKGKVAAKAVLKVAAVRAESLVLSVAAAEALKAVDCNPTIEAMVGFSRVSVSAALLLAVLKVVKAAADKAWAGGLLPQSNVPVSVR